MVKESNHQNFWMAMVNLGKKAILYAMFNFILLLVNVVMKINNAFANQASIGTQASVTKNSINWNIRYILSHPNKINCRNER